MSNAPRGNVRNPRLYKKSKLYQYNAMLQYLPDGITPTDIDSCVERNHKFQYTEFKEQGKQLDKGQSTMLYRRLTADKVNGCLFVCEHLKLNEVHVPADITRFVVATTDPGDEGVSVSKPQSNSDARGFGWWCGQWLLRCDGRPNSFVTEFRKLEREKWPWPLLK